MLAALTDMKEQPDAMDDAPNDADDHDRDSSSDDGEEYVDHDDDTGAHGQTGTVHRGRSRLARTTFAGEVGRRPARERLSGIHTLMMAASEEMDAMDAMDAADDDMIEDSNDLSQQPSDAVDDGPADAADMLEAATRMQAVPRAAGTGASFTAAGQGGPGMVPALQPGFSYVQLLQPEQQHALQPQFNQGMHQHHAGMATNLQVAPLVVEPLHTSVIDFMRQQAQLQLQQTQVQLQQQRTLQLQLLMQYPATAQLLLQQPALLDAAGILLQGQMRNSAVNPATQLRDLDAHIPGVAPANAGDSGVNAANSY
jgi:hypothetical protein